jgi:hypothetical protein
MLEVMISRVFLRLTVWPWPSVRRPSSMTCRRTLKVSGWAFSISSSSTRTRAGARGRGQHEGLPHRTKPHVLPAPGPRAQRAGTDPPARADDQPSRTTLTHLRLPAPTSRAASSSPRRARARRTRPGIRPRTRRPCARRLSAETTPPASETPRYPKPSTVFLTSRAIERWPRTRLIARPFGPSRTLNRRFATTARHSCH